MCRPARVRGGTTASGTASAHGRGDPRVSSGDRWERPFPRAGPASQGVSFIHPTPPMVSYAL
ncbi:hypothetical protein GCM10009602_27490 [Nocardiopsis tropica]